MENTKRYIMNLPVVDRRGKPLTVLKVDKQIEKLFPLGRRHPVEITEIYNYEIKLHSGARVNWQHEYGDVITVTVDSNMPYIDFVSRCVALLDLLNLEHVLSNSYTRGEKPQKIYRRRYKRTPWEPVSDVQIMTAQGLRWNDQFSLLQA